MHGPPSAPSRPATCALNRQAGFPATAAWSRQSPHRRSGAAHHVGPHLATRQDRKPRNTRAPSPRRVWIWQRPPDMANMLERPVFIDGTRRRKTPGRRTPARGAGQIPARQCRKCCCDDRLRLSGPGRSDTPNGWPGATENQRVADAGDCEFAGGGVGRAGCAFMRTKHLAPSCVPSPTLCRFGQAFGPHRLKRRAGLASRQPAGYGGAGVHQRRVRRGVAHDLCHIDVCHGKAVADHLILR